MKKVYVSLICLFLTLFLTYVYKENRTATVIEITSPDVVVLDKNKNGMADVDEVFNIKDVECVSYKFIQKYPELKKKYGLKDTDIFLIEYLEKQYVNSVLGGKTVAYKVDKDTNLAEIVVEGKSYSSIFKAYPFSLTNGLPTNEQSFKTYLKRVIRMDYKIYNNKSNKFHTLDCKYGQMAHDVVLVPFEQLPKSAQACKSCSKKKTKVNSANDYHISQIKPINFALKQGSINLYLSDLTTVLKPNNTCNTEYCKLLLNQINTAKTSIDIAIYGYSNIPAITQALKNAKTRGVALRLVYDTDSRNSNIYEDTPMLVKLIGDSKTDNINKKTKPMIMHDKFIIIDNQKVFTGSANLSTTDMSGYSSNAILFINSPKVAEIYKEEFEQMYKGFFHNEKSRSANKEAVMLDNTKLSVYFSPQDEAINNVIIPKINGAKRYIYVPTFLITHKNLTNALIVAKRRGVDVRMIIDATNASQKYTKHDELRKSGIPVKVENFAGKLHSKSIIIDDKYTIIGSMNFSNSGETKNDENMIVFENPAMTVFYRKFFEYLWAKIPQKYLERNVRSESRDSIGSCFDGIDNNFDGKTDAQDEACRQK